MKKKQFLPLIERLRQELGELHIQLPMVIFPPTVEIVKGLCFDRSSDADCFYIEAFFMPLSVPSDHISFSLGRRIGGINQKWNINDPLLLEKVLVSIREEAIPFLKHAQTPQLASDYAAARASMSNSPYQRQANAYLLARSGDIAGAVSSLELLLSSLKKDISWQAEIASRAEHLRLLLTTNPDKAAAQLKEWERHTIEHLKIGKFVG